MEEEKEIEVLTKLYGPDGLPIVLTFFGTEEYRMENGDVVIMKDNKTVGRVVQSIVAAVHTSQVECRADALNTTEDLE